MLSNSCAGSHPPRPSASTNGPPYRQGATKGWSPGWATALLILLAQALVPLAVAAAAAAAPGPPVALPAAAAIQQQQQYPDGTSDPPVRHLLTFVFQDPTVSFMAVLEEQTPASFGTSQQSLYKQALREAARAAGADVVPSVSILGIQAAPGRRRSLRRRSILSAAGTLAAPGDQDASAAAISAGATMVDTLIMFDPSETVAAQQLHSMAQNSPASLLQPTAASLGKLTISNLQILGVGGPSMPSPPLGGGNPPASPAESDSKPVGMYVGIAIGALAGVVAALLIVAFLLLPKLRRRRSNSSQTAKGTLPHQLAAAKAAVKTAVESAVQSAAWYAAVASAADATRRATMAGGAGGSGSFFYHGGSGSFVHFYPPTYDAAGAGGSGVWEAEGYVPRRAYSWGMENEGWGPGVAAAGGEDSTGRLPPQRSRLSSLPSMPWRSDDLGALADGSDHSPARDRASEAAQLAQRQGRSNRLLRRMSSALRRLLLLNGRLIELNEVGVAVEAGAAPAAGEHCQGQQPPPVELSQQQQQKQQRQMQRHGSRGGSQSWLSQLPSLPWLRSGGSSSAMLPETPTPAWLKSGSGGSSLQKALETSWLKSGSGGLVQEVQEVQAAPETELPWLTSVSSSMLQEAPSLPWLEGGKGVLQDAPAAPRTRVGAEGAREGVQGFAAGGRGGGGSSNNYEISPMAD